MSKPEFAPPTQPGESLSIGLPGRDLEGQTLGDFRVERLLGRGGMGEVYLARQISLDRPVALKVLKSELLSNPGYLARFEAEAAAAAKLNHANVVHIYAVGSAEGVRFIAMEYVQGTTLRDYMTRRGIPELPLALSIMRQSAVAVGAAGEIGLVHRDIKPDNLLLTKKGQVKVADFGLVLMPEGERLNVTQPGVTLGTPMYMSPEQVEGRPMDHRSDLYSLGVTFYHMLAGTPPFRAETGLALALKHLRETPTSLAVHRPDLPPDLVRLVMKLMEKAPANRYQSASELLRDLARIREQVAAATPALTAQATVPLPSAPTPSASGVASQVGTPGPGGPGGFRLGPGLVGLVAAAALAVGLGLGWRDREVDALSPSAAQPTGMPALWLSGWRDVPKQKTALQQYRYAQTRAPRAAQEGAWLAVPGYFPREADAASNAYTQLARYYLRAGDVARLDALADDLARSKRSHDKLLASVAEAGAAALRDDPQEVGSLLNKLQVSTLEPSLAEICLEAVARARRARVITSADSETLAKIRNQLLTNLRLESFPQVDPLTHD